MEISKLVETKGYKNSTVKICEFLDFSDTDQLKRAKFFAIQETYSPIPVLGISINNGDPTWRLCEVNNDVDELYSVDKGYKICLKVCNEHGGNIYYQSDFLSLLILFIAPMKVNMKSNTLLAQKRSLMEPF